MRKTVSIIVFITGLISSAYLYPPKDVKCDQYRNGTFYYHFKMNEKISHFTFTRNDSTQAEVNNDNGNIALYNIRWIDNCSYELKFIEGTEKLPENLLSLKKKMVIKTTILAGTNEYYLFKSTSNLSDGVLSDTIWLKK
jgi:hypothetical protein